VAEVLRCDRDGCERTTSGPRAGAAWIVLARHGRERDFCSWECVGKYADAKVKAAQVGASEKEHGDEPGRSG
jgi:hypothetical protein